MKRRELLTQGSVALAGVCLFGSSSLPAQAATRLSLRDAAKAEKAVAEVAAFVQQYSPNATLFVQERRGQRRCLVKAPIGSLPRFVEALTAGRGLPFENVHCEGSVMRFQHRGTAFVLQHLS